MGKVHRVSRFRVERFNPISPPIYIFAFLLRCARLLAGIIKTVGKKYSSRHETRTFRLEIGFD